MPQMQRQQPSARPSDGDGFELGLVIVLGAVMLVAFFVMLSIAVRLAIG